YYYIIGFMKNRKRNRMKGYDYSRDNLYFVTVCVQGRVCCLGRVVAGLPESAGSAGTGRDLSVRGDLGKCNHIMVLNEFGEIVQNRLLWLAQQYPYVLIHNFVVMPNHVHAIIEIDSLKVKGEAVKIKSLSSLMGAFKTT